MMEKSFRIWDFFLGNCCRGIFFRAFFFRALTRTAWRFRPVGATRHTQSPNGAA